MINWQIHISLESMLNLFIYRDAWNTKCDDCLSKYNIFKCFWSKSTEPLATNDVSILAFIHLSHCSLLKCFANNLQCSFLLLCRELSHSQENGKKRPLHCRLDPFTSPWAKERIMMIHEQHQWHLPIPCSVYAFLKVQKSAQRARKRIPCPVCNMPFPHSHCPAQMVGSLRGQGAPCSHWQFSTLPHIYQLAPAWRASCVLHVCSLCVMHFPETGRKYYRTLEMGKWRNYE